MPNGGARAATPLVAPPPQRGTRLAFHGGAHVLTHPFRREANMMIRWNSPLRASVLAAVALGLACSQRADPVAPEFWMTGSSATSATSYSGRATVVQATLLTLAPVTLVDAGPLPPQGGAEQASLLNASVPGLLTAEALHASTIGQATPAGPRRPSHSWRSRSVGTASRRASSRHARQPCAPTRAPPRAAAPTSRPCP